MTGATPPFLPYGRQLIEEDDIAAVTAVLRGDWLTTGPAVEAFEHGLAERVGAAHAVACASGTAGLHLACAALGLTETARAVVPALTFVATANAVRFTGAEVVFADVDSESGLMGAAEFSAALDRAASDDGAPVRAVLPVHLGGQCVDPPTIAAIARDNGLAVIADAAHAIGTAYRIGDQWRAVGSGADTTMTVFSFHPVKTIAMGEGGAVTTDDDALAARLRRLRNHGMERDPAAFTRPDLGFDDGLANPWYYEVSELGWNYRATDFQCALGLSQLAKLDRFVVRRAALAARYDTLLAPLAPTLRPTRSLPNCRPGRHLYSVLIDFKALGRGRASVMGDLRRDGIGSQVHYMPLHMQPYYRERYGEARLPGAERYYARTLSLPLFPSMTETDVDRTVTALAKVLGLA